MSYTKIANDDNRIQLEDLTPIVERDDTLDIYNQIMKQYLVKVGKERVENLMRAAIAIGDQDCLIIDDEYYTYDGCERDKVFYDMGICDELTAILPSGTRISTCDYNVSTKKKKCRRRYMVQIWWGSWTLFELFINIFCTCRPPIIVC